MGDRTPFDASFFEDMPPPQPGRLQVRKGASTTEQMALDDVLSDPDRDANEIRAIYGLEKLDEADLAAWVGDLAGYRQATGSQFEASVNEVGPDYELHKKGGA